MVYTEIGKGQGTDGKAQLDKATQIAQQKIVSAYNKLMPEAQKTLHFVVQTKEYGSFIVTNSIPGYPGDDILAIYTAIKGPKLKERLDIRLRSSGTIEPEGIGAKEQKFNIELRDNPQLSEKILSAIAVAPKLQVTETQFNALASKPGTYKIDEEKSFTITKPGNNEILIKESNGDQWRVKLDPKTHKVTVSSSNPESPSVSAYQVQVFLDYINRGTPGKK